MTAPAPLPMPANRRDYGPLAYVAAASAEARRVPPVLAALERIGVGLTRRMTIPPQRSCPKIVSAAGASHDWGADLAEALAEGLAANGVDRAARERVALRREAGATHAEVFVLLAPPAGIETRGAWVEMGLAVAEPIGLEIDDEEAREERRAQDRDEADFARTRGL